MDRVIEHIIEKNCLLRDFLRSKYSYRRIHFLREGGKIFLNEKEVTIRERANAGDKLKLVFSETQTFNYQPKDMGLCEVYQDEDLLVVYKPSGVACMPVAPYHENCLYNGLAYLYPNRVFRVVTRLDKNTSGLVLLAKNALTHSILYEQVREIKKEYIALVEGQISAPRTIDKPIYSDGGRKRLVDERGKSAITNIFKSEKLGENTLVWINLLTGRTHQIRVHLSHVGNPLYGDEVYGAKTKGGQMLVCQRLEVENPITKKMVVVSLDGKKEILKRMGG